MILTITEAECAGLTVRGGLPGVIDDYCGPAWRNDGEDWASIAVLDWIPDPGFVWVADAGRISLAKPSTLRLPLARPEVQARLVGWLGRGAVCGECGGCGHDDPGEGPSTVNCPDCKGTGWLRRPFDCYAWLRPEVLGGTQDWIQMALIAGSVARVAGGWGPIGRIRYSDAPKRTVQVTDGRVTLNGYPFGSVEEAEAEIARCNADALAKGDALVESNPTGRVIRFEVPDAG